MKIARPVSNICRTLHSGSPLANSRPNYNQLGLKLFSCLSEYLAHK